MADRRSALRSKGHLFLLLAPVAFLALFFLLPIAKMGWISIWNGRLTFDNYAKVAESSIYFDSLIWTFQLAIGTSFLCLLFGYPVAYVMANGSRRLRLVILTCIILPFWTSSLVRAFAWLAILSRRGIVNFALVNAGFVDDPLKLVFNSVGVYIGTVHIMLPYMILNLYGVMSGIDRSGMLAAETLGAGRIRAFFLIYVPQTGAGIISGLLVVFILSLGFFVTPSVLGGSDVRSFVVLVERYMNQLLNWPLASALSVLVLVATLALYFGFYRYVRLGKTADQSNAGALTLYRALALLDKLFKGVRRNAQFMQGLVRTHGPRRPRVTTALALVIAAISAFPILLVAITAFTESQNANIFSSGFTLRWFRLYWDRYEWIEATINSFQIALITAFCSCVLATLAALGLRRLSGGAGGIVLALFLTPMIVPTIVFGVAIYLLFAAFSLVGTKTGLVLAHTILALPPALLICYSALQGLDERIEQAAASLGAGPWQVFRHIVLRSLAPAIGAGALLGFLTSFDDLGVALFMTSGDTMTLPRKIYDSIRLESDPRVTAASALLVGISLLFLIGFQFLRGRMASPSASSASQARRR